MPGESSQRAAIVVAHPDDELIFFGALVGRLVAAGWAVDVVCVTGRFGSPNATGIRRVEFSRTCCALGMKARMLNLLDGSGPLDEAALAQQLAERVRWGQYARVYTHGPWGEYGHPHHIQVCRATHWNTNAVRCLAGPFEPDHIVALSPAELDRKRQLAARTYRSQPFAVDWCADTEHLVELSRAEVEVLTSLALCVAAGDQAAPLAAPGLPLPALIPSARHPDSPTFPGVTHLPEPIWRDGHRARVRALDRWLGQNGAGAPVTDFSK